MLENKLRPKFQTIFVAPVAKKLSHYFTPNQVSIFALGCGLFSALFLVFDWVLASIILLLLSGYFDVVDGSIARIKNESSAFGTMLDILSDRMVEAAIVIALVLRQPELSIVGLFMLSSMLLCVSSFLVAGIFSTEVSHKSFHYSSGLMERAEAFAFFILMILFPSWSIGLGILFTVLVLWTAGVRLYEFHKMTQSLDR